MWIDEKFAYLIDREKPTEHMDGFHVSMIYNWIMANEPFHVVEIGCHHGYSTSAIVQAHRDDWRGFASCVDVHISAELFDLIRSDIRTNIFRDEGHNGLKRAAMVRTVDCVIVDGDHKWGSVKKEYDVIRQLGIKNVIAHDVSECGDDGPRRMMEDMIASDQWEVSIDDKRREGMMTHRGLMFAVKRNM